MAKYIVALSGGKDSTAMALKLKELWPDRVFMYIVTITGDELPEQLEHLSKLELLLGAPLIRLGDIGLLDLIREQRMIPNFRARFCTRILKIEPFFEYLNSLDGPVVWYSGLRADESTREGVVSDKIVIEYPLREWGWGLAEVEQYLHSRGITIPERTDCGACFFQRLTEWKSLLDNYPERYAEYEAIEAEVGHTFRSPQRDTWPASLKELRHAFESGRPLRKWERQRTSLQCSWCAR